MTEPILAIAAVLVAFGAGAIGGYCLGWRDGCLTRLYKLQMRRVYNAKKRIDGQIS